MATTEAKRASVGHTPGPWRNWCNGTITGGYAGCGTHICDMPSARWAASQAQRGIPQDVADWLGECHAESQANARLIALSPDLADFARECARADSDCGDAIRERARRLLVLAGLIGGEA